MKIHEWTTFTYLKDLPVFTASSTRQRFFAALVKSLILVAVALIAWLVYPRFSRDASSLLIEAGKPWPYEKLTAQFDFPIYKTDARLAQEKEDLLASLTPCFKHIDGRDTRYLILSVEDWEQLQKEEYTSISVISPDHTARTVLLRNVYTPKTAYLATGEEMLPNLIEDTLTNSKLRKTVLANLSETQGMVQAGEKIIDRGDIVTPATHQILVSLMRAETERDSSGYITGMSGLYYFILALFVMGFLAVYLIIFRPRLWAIKSLTFFALLMSLMIITTSLLIRFTDHQWFWVVPLAWVPILTRVFYDSRTAFFLHLTTCIIIALATPQPFLYFFVQACAGGIAVATLWDVSQRAQLARTAGMALLTYAVTYPVLFLYSFGTFETIDWYIYLYFIINAVLIICAYGVIYLFEKMFRLVSSITLVELTDINSQLMHEFAETAPGSFQHSLQVSNIASSAARAIEANALLVRAGSLYHDIGKMAAPLNYTENQAGGDNPLLSLSNQEAARQVITHVTEGERIARKHRLPEVLIQFIRTHHGTSLTRYFYNSEVRRVGAENVNPADFAYPGPRPQTKEAAIVMMADAIEARSRSLDRFTPETVSQMVDDMIDLQMQSGQFADTQLSFRDVETLRRVFKERLMLIYHHRIQYPELPKNENTKS